MIDSINNVDYQWYEMKQKMEIMIDDMNLTDIQRNKFYQLVDDIQMILYCDYPSDLKCNMTIINENIYKDCHINDNIINENLLFSWNDYCVNHLSQFDKKDFIFDVIIYNQKYQIFFHLKNIIMVNIIIIFIIRSKLIIIL